MTETSSSSQVPDAQLTRTCSSTTGPDDVVLERMFDMVDQRTDAQTRLHEALGAGFLWLARERYRDGLAMHRLAQVARDGREMEAQRVVPLDAVPWSTQGNHGGDDDDNETKSNEQVESTGLRRRRGGGGMSENDDDGNGMRDVMDKGVDNGCEKRQGEARVCRSRYVGFPSRELREAVRSFDEAVDAAVELAKVSARVREAVAGVDGGGDVGRSAKNCSE